MDNLLLRDVNCDGDFINDWFFDNVDDAENRDLKVSADIYAGDDSDYITDYLVDIDFYADGKKVGQIRDKRMTEYEVKGMLNDPTLEEELDEKADEYGWSNTSEGKEEERREMEAENKADEMRDKWYDRMEGKF